MIDRVQLCGVFEAVKRRRIVTALLLLLSSHQCFPKLLMVDAKILRHSGDLVQRE